MCILQTHGGCDLASIYKGGAIAVDVGIWPYIRESFTSSQYQHGTALLSLQLLHVETVKC